MSTKRDVLDGINAMHASLREVEQSALAEEEAHAKMGRQIDLLVGQGQSNSETLGTIMTKLSEILSRLDHYIDDADKQGGRINQLEREVRELRNAE